MNQNTYQGNARHYDHSKHIELTVASADEAMRLIRHLMKDEAEETAYEVLRGDRAEKPADVPEASDCGFDRNRIKSLITAEEKDVIADILIEMMGPYVGKNKPKQALLPLYCAIYEINWIAQRPEYETFAEAFPGLINSKTSYKDYVPTVKECSNYLKDSCKGVDVESMCETLLLALKSRLSA